LIKRGEEMIVKSRKSFKEISSECGFYDQNYFSKAFTKKYGLSPKEYRQKKAESL
jgi:AraC family L-rhamnose operon regulatory protein RhaS